MVVDTMTYIPSMVAEHPEIACLRLLVPALSMSALAYATVSAFLESLAGISGGGGNGNVNPYIVHFVSVWRFILDSVVIIAFFRNHDRSKNASGGGFAISMLLVFAHMDGFRCGSSSWVSMWMVAW